MSLFAVLACAGNAPPPAAGTPDPVPAPAPAPAPADPPTGVPPAEPIDAALVPGSWVGRACGERKWVRTFVFESGGNYHGTDPVSPCPPNAQCVWSGIITFDGTWAVTDQQLVLTERPAQMATQYQRPPALTLAGGALYDANGCAFERQP